MFIQYNSEDKDILYSKCNIVKDITSNEIQNIIVEMYSKMKGNGLGLAANQIGHPYQIFMIEFNKANTTRYTLDFPDVPFQVFINPVITKCSSQKVSFWHGCLSAIASQRAKLATYKEIEYEAYNEFGEKISGKLGGLAAVIFQHEFAHLIGVMYVDFDTEFLAKDILNDKMLNNEISLYEECDDNIPLIIAQYKIGKSI